MYEYKVQSYRVIDGDTVECVIDLGFRITVKETFRLIGINAPEMKTPQGPPAKAHLTTLLSGLNNDLTIRSEKSKQEKYGRWLGIFYCKTGMEFVDVNQKMISDGFAVPFMTDR